MKPKSNERFPLIELKGTPEEIGFQHGELLAERIKTFIEFSKKIFKKSEQEIFQAGEFFKTKVAGFSLNYIEEIDAIAQGAGVDSRYLYVLNARSEIFSWIANECTAAHFKKSSIIGQNWDWAQEMESLAVIMKIQRTDGHKILMITQPGIIGKIGMNSSGIGVCENSLKIAKRLSGVPLHIILRALLDSTSLKQAYEKIERAKFGKSGNVLVADSTGNYFDVEFAGDEIFNLKTADNIFIHTNHYLGADINKNKEKFEETITRLERGNEITKSIMGKDIEEMKKILLDDANKTFPICRPFVKDQHLGTMGTVCSIIMDLRKKQMQITKGSPLKNKFETFYI